MTKGELALALMSDISDVERIEVIKTILSKTDVFIQSANGNSERLETSKVRLDSDGKSCKIDIYSKI